MKSRSSHPEVFCRKGVLKNFAKFRGVEVCEIFKNIFLTEHLRTTVSASNSLRKT